MLTKDVELIVYSKKVDFWNTATHTIGIALSVIGLIAMLIKAESTRHFVSALIFGISLIAVYTASSVYHGLRQGEAKRKARLIDHSTVPILIAGTATPCAMITLYDVSIAHCIIVLILAWTCTVFGIISKIFFFEKLKNATVIVYIISGTIMFLSVIPILEQIDATAFRSLLAGGVMYVIGAVLCGLGTKKEWLHVVFHVFVLFGSIIHFLVIYFYMI